jgi:DNA primase
VRLSNEQRSLLKNSAETYHRSLPLAMDYLARRGLSPDLVDGEMLGYVENPLPGQEQFRGRLSIPYVTRNGVVNLKFRSLDDEKPKYLYLHGFESSLYHVESFFEASDFLCVAEGEIDALSLVSAGLPCIGVPGAKSWKAFYRRCFEDFPVIYVFCDGDEPGRYLGKFLAKEIKARPIHMPNGQDVNSMLVSEGPEFLRSKINV